MRLSLSPRSLNLRIVRAVGAARETAPRSFPRIGLLPLLCAVWLTSSCSGSTADPDVPGTPMTPASITSEGPAASTDKATFTVMTYNTGLAGGPSNLDLREPGERLPDLVALITDVGADIVGLQEVSAQHRAAFESQLSSFYEFYDGEDARNGEVILLARDTFTVREHGVEAFASDCRSDLKVTYLVAETSAGQTIGLINTHLCRPNPASNVEQLADVMTKRLSDLPVILTGALNAAEGSDTINYLMGLGAADQGTNPTPLQDSWSLAAKAESKREAGAIPIDWILVADGAAEFRSTSPAHRPCLTRRRLLTTSPLRPRFSSDRLCPDRTYAVERP